jgi:polyisoprenoid-binding protein YceI
MKMPFRRLVGAAASAGLALVLAAPSAKAETLKIDADHSSVTFKVRHLLTKVQGRFQKFEGTVDFDEKSFGASKVSATIQAASVDTNVEARDKDLRSKRFFDVERFPTLTFTSLAVTEVSGNKGKVRGTLSMHGVSKEVVLSTEYLGKGKDPWGNTRYGFHAETTINRKDFGMAWNEALEAGGLLVGDEVEIALDVEAVPAK